MVKSKTVKRRISKKIISIGLALCVLTAGFTAEGSLKNGFEINSSEAYAADTNSKMSTAISSIKQVKYESLNIKWKKLGGTKEYQILRADKQNGTYKKIAVVSGTSYNDADIRQNKTYYYKIKPLVKGAKESALKSGKIKTAVSLSKIPKQKAGTAYVEVNGGKPAFSKYEKKRKGFEEYAALDKFGRCGMAYAYVDESMMPTEKRGSIGMIKPSGWHTVRYDDLISDKYLYNRCHLIGYQLTGQNANKLNLVTGTRYMNVTGMLPFEDEVAEYIKKTGNHVLYRVTPIFKGNNLVCSGVQMEAQSIEDNRISFNVFAYNSQPGIVIDYKTGDSHIAGKDAEAAGDDGASSTKNNAAAKSYVLNTNTKKFHYASCSSVRQMSEQNKKLSGSMTRSEIISKGYEPCGRCNP